MVFSMPNPVVDCNPISVPVLKQLLIYIQHAFNVTFLSSCSSAENKCIKDSLLSYMTVCPLRSSEGALLYVPPLTEVRGVVVRATSSLPQNSPCCFPPANVILHCHLTNTNRGLWSHSYVPYTTAYLQQKPRRAWCRSSFGTTILDCWSNTSGSSRPQQDFIKQIHSLGLQFDMSSATILYTCSSE